MSVSRLRALIWAALLSLPACGPRARPAGEITLVESAPIETTLDHPDIPDAHQIWPAMIGGAAASSAR